MKSWDYRLVGNFLLESDNNIREGVAIYMGLSINYGGILVKWPILLGESYLYPTNSQCFFITPHNK